MELLAKIKDKKATVSIVGVGYVGLPNVVLFAENGFQVIATDKSSHVIELLSQGKSHINDPELNRSVPKAFATGRIRATMDATFAANGSDCILISVPTPVKNGDPDLSFVEQSARAVGKGLQKGTLVVLESTVFPGVCEKTLGRILAQESGLIAGKDFLIAHCPERMNPGDSKHTIFNTPRIVGGINQESLTAAKALYESVGLTVHGVANVQTAELVKLVENTQRDVNIAFISEIAKLCEKTGVNVLELVSACSTKWNFYPVLPGAGVGGHCLPNNPYYILKAAKKAGVKMPLMMQARKTNDEMPAHVVAIVEKTLLAAGMKIGGSTVALLGISYKSNVDDVRQAPSRTIAELLEKKGAKVIHHDPLVNKGNAAKVRGNAVNLEEALAADALVVLCKHDAFKTINAADVSSKAIVDTVFLFQAGDFPNFSGVGIG